jgi:energy-coupling factor transporter ATP-binding protein EcfA2
MPAVIEVRKLRKSYGDTVAVDDVSFTVGEGEIFGILGPNGAGKTTTVECIEGLRTPDGGAIRLRVSDRGRGRRGVQPRPADPGDQAPVRGGAGEAGVTDLPTPPACGLLHFSRKYRRARSSEPNGTFVIWAWAPGRHMRHTWLIRPAGRPVRARLTR